MCGRLRVLRRGEHVRMGEFERAQGLRETTKQTGKQILSNRTRKQGNNLSA